MNLSRIIETVSAHCEIHDWLVRSRTLNQHQLYLIGNEVESVRTVRDQVYEIIIYNDHDGKRGSGTIIILPAYSDEMLKKLIEDGVFMAELVGNPIHQLPGPAVYPAVEMFDTKNPGEGLEEVKATLVSLIAKEQGVRLASAEFFWSETETVLRNSRGIDTMKKETDLFCDFVLVSSDGAKESETHMEFRRRRFADLDWTEIIPRYARYARDSLRANLPRTGLYPVVVSHEEVCRVFEPFRVMSSGWALYRNLSQFKKGESAFGARPVKGDALNLTSNGLCAFGSKTSPFDDDGVAANRTLLIKEGIVNGFWATKEYADYLGMEPTGRFANTEVLSGVTPYSDLLASGPVYEIVSFSSLEPDPITGNFVGEIRLGYEHSERESRTIKGGSVSGNVFDCFANARFARETVFLGDYLGPKAIRFEELAFGGD